MSRTVRRAGIGTDYLPTPPWVVDALFNALGPARLAAWGSKWLEPAVGDGAIVRAVDTWFEKHKLLPVEWTTIDIREEVAPSIIGPFQTEPRPGFDVIITNPPFSQADEFVRTALRSKARIMVMLLSSSWPGGAKRNTFVREHTPDQYLIPDRISFDRQGNDYVYHSWFVWGDHIDVNLAHWSVLGTTLRSRRVA